MVLFTFSCRKGITAVQTEFYSANGALLLQQRNLLSEAFDLSGLPADIYQILVVGSDGKLYWGRVVKK